MPTQSVVIELDGTELRVLAPRGKAVAFAESLNVFAGMNSEQAQARAVGGAGPGTGRRLPTASLTPPVANLDVRTWKQAHILGVDRDAPARGKQGLFVLLVFDLLVALLWDRLTGRATVSRWQVVTIDPVAREIRWQPEHEYGLTEPASRPVGDLVRVEVIKSRVDWGPFDRIMLDLGDTQLHACVPKFKGTVFAPARLAFAQTPAAAGSDEPNRSRIDT